MKFQAYLIVSGLIFSSLAWSEEPQKQDYGKVFTWAGHLIHVSQTGANITDGERAGFDINTTKMRETYKDNIHKMVNFEFIKDGKNITRANNFFTPNLGFHGNSIAQTFTIGKEGEVASTTVCYIDHSSTEKSHCLTATPGLCKELQSKSYNEKTLQDELNSCSNLRARLSKLDFDLSKNDYLKTELENISQLNNSEMRPATAGKGLLGKIVGVNNQALDENLQRLFDLKELCTKMQEIPMFRGPTKSIGSNTGTSVPVVNDDFSGTVK